MRLPATFVRDGVERVAATKAEAVRLKWDGWRVKPEPRVEPEPPAVEPVDLAKHDDTQTSLDLAE